MRKYFEPLMNEIRTCEIVHEECDQTITTFRDVLNDEYFTTESRGGQWTERRQAKAQEASRNHPYFLVKFDVHMYGDRIDANHFVGYGEDWDSL